MLQWQFFYICHVLRYCIYITFLFTGSLNAQTLGGNAVFNFLSQPNSAQLSSLGGVNVSSIGNDVGMVFHSPSLLRDEMHGQVSASFNSFLAGIRNYSLSGAWHFNKPTTNLAVGVNYFDYGTLTQTDASGNVYGTFRPVDYVVQVTASKQYHERFHYGITVKYINSNYGAYRSSALGFDAGISYYDSSRLLQVSLVVKNIGAQLSTYDGSTAEELPFDLQAGITKRLANAPIQFSLTAHHLHRFNILYNDTTFRAGEGENNYTSKRTIDNLFSHLVLSTQIFLSDKLELSAGYNFLRRQELNAYNLTSGLNGFSFGAGLLLKKLQVKYATGFYQSNLFHQLSLNFRMIEVR